MKLAIHGAILAGAILLSGCDGGGGGSVPVCTGNFTACGGDLTGKWSIDGVCTEGDLQDMFMDPSDYPAECSGMVQSFSIDMSGTLAYANGIETSDVTMVMNAKANYSKACIQALVGAPVEVTQAICDAATGGSDGVMTCKLSNGGCACTMAMNERTQDSGAYTTSGGVLSYDDGGDSIAYCVSGSSLTFRSETESGGPAMRIKTHRVE